ncbi:MAG TPA: hypothetical protein VHD34_04315 [Xanthobacteraceae bacterium]|nr:hypothetical protein [Xanthobacteraceae bacterium]
MLKHLFVALFLFASAAPAGAAPDMFLRERCHRGECSFTRIIQTKTIGKNAGGYMLEVKARSASLRIPPKADDPSTMKPPKNYGLVRVLYVYCSTEKPALIFYDDKKFYAHLLKIGEPAAGYEIDSHIEYWAVCHDKIVSVADVAEGKLAKEAADLGYGKFPENWGRQRDFRTKKKAFRSFGL